MKPADALPMHAARYVRPALPPRNGWSRRDCLACTAAALLPGVSLAQPAVGFDWPALRLLDGTTLQPADWHGTAAVVAFWATHCPFCKRHNAHLNKLHRSLAGRPVRVLGVALDRDALLVQRYMASNGYEFAVTTDGATLRQRLSPRRVIPTTLTIGRDGRVSAPIHGEMSEEDVMELATLVAS